MVNSLQPRYSSYMYKQGMIISSQVHKIQKNNSLTCSNILIKVNLVKVKWIKVKVLCISGISQIIHYMRWKYY